MIDPLELHAFMLALPRPTVRSTGNEYSSGYNPTDSAVGLYPLALVLVGQFTRPQGCFCRDRTISIENKPGPRRLSRRQARRQVQYALGKSVVAARPLLEPDVIEGRRSAAHSFGQAIDGPMARRAGGPAIVRRIPMTRPVRRRPIIDITHVLAGPFATYQLGLPGRRCDQGRRSLTSRTKAVFLAPTTT